LANGGDEDDVGV